MHELDKETNKSHHQKTDSSGQRNLFQFFRIGLGALVEESAAAVVEVHKVLFELSDSAPWSSSNTSSTHVIGYN